MIARVARVVDRLDLVHGPLRRCVDQAANAVIVGALGRTLRSDYVGEISNCGGSWMSSTIRYGNDRGWVDAYLDGVKSREASDEHFRA